MTWTNHKLITIAVITAYLGKYILTPHIFYLFPAVFGSIFPDLVEGKPPADKMSAEYQRWQKTHRQYSHWFIIYAVSLLFLYILWKFSLDKYGYIKVANEILIGVIFFLYGCLLHLLQDSICGKIPSINPQKRIGIRLFKVGSFTENIITIILLIVILSVFLHRVS